MIKVLTILSALAIAALARTEDFGAHWENFKRVHEKRYEPAEEFHRRQIFNKNLRTIIKHNVEHDLGIHSFRLGVNKFADLRPEEFAAQFNGYRGKKSHSNLVYRSTGANDLPTEVDWRDKGLVTGVKNQGQCGSCWAFSAIASLEGQHAKATKKLVSLSEQNLVDCSTAEGNQGCNGGLMDQAYDYIKKNKGVDTEDSYPYEAQDDTCRYKNSSVGATITGYVDIKTGDEQALTDAAAKIGPIAVAIDASSIFFQLYFGGVYDHPSCGNALDQLDHGVTVVGYGTEKGKDYYLVKNSWGGSWGESGYIKMSRGKNNQCGIATSASYPLV